MSLNVLNGNNYNPWHIGVTAAPLLLNRVNEVIILLICKEKRPRSGLSFKKGYSGWGHCR